MGKITSYPDGGALTAGDKLVIARSPYSSGTTYSINYSTAGLISALTGDVTASGSGSVAATIAANAVTYAKFQQVAASSLVGNATGSLANAAEITLGNNLTFSGSTINIVTTPAFSSVNLSSGATLNDVWTCTNAGTGAGSWQAPSGGNAITALTGDVTATGPGSAVATIAANAVTYAKFQQVAASSLVGNPTGSLANGEGITLGTSLTFSGTAINTVQGITTGSLVQFGSLGIGYSPPSSGKVAISGLTLIGENSQNVASSIFEAAGGFAFFQYSTTTYPLTQVSGGGLAIAYNRTSNNEINFYNCYSTGNLAFDFWAIFNSSSRTRCVGIWNNAGLSVGSTYSDNQPPSNSLIVQSQVGVGTTSVGASAIMQLSSTTQGFLPPSMTTTQKNAIASPASGLLLFDNVINDLYYWNGSGWIGVATAGSGVTSISGTANQINPTSPTSGAVTLSFPATVQINGAISANVQFQVTQNQGYGTYLTGTCANTAGSSYQAGFYNNATYSPTSGSARTIGMWSSPIVAAPTSQTIGYASCFTASMSSAGNLGTISNYYGFYYDGTFTVNSITNMYGAYFTSPPTGTTTANQALYTDNISVGYPTLNLHGKNNIVVSGRAIFGRSTDDGSNTLQILGNTISLGTIATSGLITGSPFTYSTFTNTNYIMISSDTSGDVVWGALSSILAGTANQIDVSGSGSTTLTLTNGISIGSYQATAPPGGGIICPGAILTGSSSTFGPTSQLYVKGAAGVLIVASDGTDIIQMGANSSYGFLGTYTDIPLIFATNNQAAQLHLSTNGNFGVADNSPGTKLSVGGNCQIGFSSGTTAPSSGFIVNGQSAFGTSTADSGSNVTISGNGPLSKNIGLLINGTQTQTVGNNLGLYINETFSFSGSNSNNQGAIDLEPTITTSSGTLSGALFALQTNPQFTGNAGILSTCYGILLSAGGSSGAGSVTNGYNIYANNPGFGTTQQAIYTDNLSVGYPSTNLGGTNNVIIAGNVGIGTSSILSGSPLDIQGAGVPIIRFYGTGTSNFAGGELLLANDCTTSGQGGTSFAHNLNVSNTAQSAFSIQQRDKTGATFIASWLVFNYYNNTASFLTGNASAIFINASQQVGFIDTAPAAGISCTTNAQIGFTSGTTAPASGLAVNGRAGFGTSVGNSNSQVNISTSLAYNLLANGTLTAVDGASNQLGIYIDSTFNPTSGSNDSFGIYSGPLFIAPSGQTITNAASIACGGNLSTNVGNITRYYGFYFDGATGGAGAINTAYGMYLTQPTCAINNYAASIQGGLVLKYAGKAVSYAATTADYYIGYTSTSSPFTVTLPASAFPGWTCIIKDESGGAATNNITINGNGNNIDGASTAVIATNYGSLVLYYNGANYFII